MVAVKTVVVSPKKSGPVTTVLADPKGFEQNLGAHKLE